MIITNIYRIQACDSLMSGYFCIGYIDFMLKGKILLEHTIFFSWWLWKEWLKIVKYFQ